MKQYNKLTILILFWLLALPSALAETQAIWAKSTTKAPSGSKFYSVAIGNDSNLCVAGSIWGDEAYNFGNRITLGSEFQGTNVAILKYDDSGNAQWARSAVVAPASSDLRKAAIDTSDNGYYIAGKIQGTEIFDFGNTVRVQGDYSYDNAVLIKYDADGGAKWTKAPTISPSSSMFHNVVTDNNGTIYTSGYIDGNGVYDFGNSTTVNGSSTNLNCVLVKHDSGGNTLWARSTLGGSDFSFFGGAAVDGAKNVYAAGYTSGTDTYDFGNGVTISGSSLANNLILVKYDSNGNAQWAKSVINSSAASYAYDLAVDNSGNIYIIGRLVENLPFEFGNGVKVSGSYSGYNAFVAKYDNDGNPMWAKSTASSINSSTFYGIAIDSDGGIFVAGEIYGNEYFDFGDGVTVTGSYGATYWNQNPILVKYDSNGNAKWAKSTRSSSNRALFYDVAVDNTGNIYASGLCTGDKVFDFGNGVTAKGDFEGDNTLLVKYGDVTPTSGSSSSSSGTTPSSSSAPSSVISSSSKTGTKLSTFVGIGAAIIAAI